MTNSKFIDNTIDNILKECPDDANFRVWLNSEYQEVDMAKDFVKYLDRHNLTIDDYLNMREVWDKMDVEMKCKILFKGKFER